MNGGGEDKVGGEDEDEDEVVVVAVVGMAVI